MRSSIQLLVVVAAFSADAVARAQDEAQAQEWPRFHIGGAVGTSQMGPDFRSAGVPEFWRNESVETTTGWKVVAGFRPVRLVGVEIQFVDFGEETETSLCCQAQVSPYVYMKTSADATVLSALLFIPEPAASVDVYGKVGVAMLDESLFAQGYDPTCQPVWCRFDIDGDQTDSRAYVGIGARLKIARELALRVEYEAIDRDVGDNTTMFSLGIAWER